MSKILKIKVTPRAKKTEITETLEDGTLKIKLKAPPVDGKANIALINFLSEYFSVPKTKISITKGEKGRNKTVEIS